MDLQGHAQGPWSFPTYSSTCLSRILPAFAMPNFSWGTPGIEIPPPTATSLTQPVPRTFSKLSFDPQGVYDLRRMLGALPPYPGQYTTNQFRFNAADVAFFAAGCSNDGKHVTAHDEFHSTLVSMYQPAGKFGTDSRHKLRDVTQKLVFDAVCPAN